MTRKLEIRAKDGNTVLDIIDILVKDSYSETCSEGPKTCYHRRYVSTDPEGVQKEMQEQINLCAEKDYQGAKVILLPEESD